MFLAQENAPAVTVDPETIEQLTVLGLPVWLVGVIVLVLILTPTVVWLLAPLRAKWSAQAQNINKGAAVLLCLGLLFLVGCGSFSQERMDHLADTRDDMIYLVERAKQDALTAIELRSKLQSQDAAMLAEQAHKGEGVEELRKKLEADSDKKVAALFNGDNGREDLPE